MSWIIIENPDCPDVANIVEDGDGQNIVFEDEESAERAAEYMAKKSPYTYLAVNIGYWEF